MNFCFTNLIKTRRISLSIPIKNTTNPIEIENKTMKKPKTMFTFKIFARNIGNTPDKTATIRHQKIIW